MIVVDVSSEHSPSAQTILLKGFACIKAFHDVCSIWQPSLVVYFTLTSRDLSRIYTRKEQWETYTSRYRFLKCSAGVIEQMRLTGSYESDNRDPKYPWTVIATLPKLNHSKAVTRTPLQKPTPEKPHDSSLMYVYYKLELKNGEKSLTKDRKIML